MDNTEKVGDVTVAVYASDMDESRDFYCYVLNFEIEIDTWIEIGSKVPPLRRTRLRLKDNPSVALELLQAATGGTATRIDNNVAVPTLTIMVPDCKAITERVAKLPDAHDAIVDQGSTPYADYVTLRDPFGNMVQAMETFSP